MKDNTAYVLVIALVMAMFIGLAWAPSNNTKKVNQCPEIEAYSKVVNEQAKIIQLKSDSIKELKFKLNTLKGITATVYYPTGHEMRSGKKIPHGYRQSTALVKYCAISQDLWKKYGGPFNFGDKILVRGINKQLDVVYEIQDTMNKRHKKRVDILVSRGSINEQWKNISVTKI